MHEKWQREPLGTYIRVQGGYAFNSEEFGDEGLPVARISSIRNGKIDLSDAPRVPISPNLSRFLLNDGDLLIAMSGATTGKTGVFRKSSPFTEAYINQRVGRVLIKDRHNANLDYFRYIIESDAFQRSIALDAIGGAQPNISGPDIESFRSQIPPLSAQRKIAQILRTWDEAIDKLEALRAAKSSALKALTRLMVFGGSRLTALDAKAAMVPYRWFTLPADWACVPIDGVAREVSERHTSGGDYEVLSCSKHDGFVRSLDYFKKQVFSADLDGYKKIWRSDFGFPSNHVEEGSIGLQNLVEVGLVSPIYTVFRFEPNQVLPEYAFAVLKTALYRHIFEVSTSASVDRRGSLRWSEFSKIPFPRPSLAEQKAIMEVLQTGKTEVDILGKEIEAMICQKRGLMQKLLTGEWRVSC